MKKILITGENSYIGTSFESWMKKWPDKYLVETISTFGDVWKNIDFHGYDVIFHVAGIVHVKETNKNKDLYYTVNRDLAVSVAEKARNDGIKQFIFLSSMSIYGIIQGVITCDTIPSPKSNAGKSKYEAEQILNRLSSDTFKIAILRPPILYGRGCKGNYPRLAKLALKMPLFPEIKNQRSMIYVDNLCELVRLLIDDCSSGLFFPQNAEYVCVSEMVKLIAEAHGKKMRMTKFFNPLLNLLKIGMVNRVFGDLVYEKSLSDCGKSYDVCDIQKSIKFTEQ